MRYTTMFGALALLPGALAAQTSTGGAAAPPGPAHVRVTARIIVLDTDAIARAGLSFAVLGDRVRVASDGRRAGGARIQAGTHDADVFLDLVRANRWVRSESTQQVLAMSGAEAVVSSTTLSIGRRSAHTHGPVLAVVPTVLEDGSVHMQLSARVEDAVTFRRGYGVYGVDGSPAAVDTELIAASGEEVIVGSSSAARRTRESGLLWWGSAEQGREVLVAVRAEVVAH